MATGEKKALSVTQLVRRMRNVLQIEVGECWVEGEVDELSPVRPTYKTVRLPPVILQT